MTCGRRIGAWCSAGLRAEQQFQEAVGQLAHLNGLLESLHEAVTIVDATGRVLLMNPTARLLFGGVEVESLDLRNLDDTPLPPDASPIPRAIRGDVFNDEELVLVRPDESGCGCCRVAVPSATTSRSPWPSSSIAT